MQDRFKFRHWDKRINIMFNSLRNDNFGEYAHNDNIITMQCTGLKDKNGKLMYENDVLKDDHGALFQIKWCYNGYELRPLFRGGYSLGLIDEEFEVIGNIYENPELLRGDD